MKSVSAKEREVHLNSTYTIQEDHRYFECDASAINLINENSLEKKKYHDVFEISYYPTIEFNSARAKMEEEKCMICLDEFEIKI